MRTDYKDFIASTENRHYRQIDNDDGTISLVDETVYTQEGDKVSAGVLNELSQNAIWPLQYAKSGTEHQLTGLTGVSGIVSCIFTATDSFAEGDTVTVDGEEYTVQMPDGESAPDKLFTSGVSVSVVVDKNGKKINFKSGGGYVKGDLIAAENLEKQSDFSKSEYFAFAYSLPFTPGFSVSTAYPWTRKWFIENVDGVSYISAFSTTSKIQRYAFDGSLVSEVSTTGTPSDYKDVILRDYNWLVLGKRQEKDYFYPRPLYIYKVDESGTKFTYLTAPQGDYDTNVYNYISYSENAIFVAYKRTSTSFPSGNLMNYKAFKSDGTELFDITDEGENIALYDYTCTKEHVIYIVRNQEYSDYHVFVYSIDGDLITSYPLTSAAFYNYEGFTSYVLFKNDMSKCMIGLSKNVGNLEIGSSYRKVIVEFDPVNNRILNVFQPGEVPYSAGGFVKLQGSESNWTVSSYIYDMLKGSTTRGLIEVDNNFRAVKVLRIPNSGSDFIKDFDYNLNYSNTTSRITLPILISGNRMVYARHDATSKTSYFDYVGKLSYKVLEVSK